MRIEKTIDDFDLTVVKDELRKQYIKIGLSNEEIDRILPSSLETLKDRLTGAFPCKTCGVKFHLNNLNHECKKEDIWLNSYIKCSMGNKELKKGYKSKLRTKYSLTGSKIGFRGINFLTEEEYDTFMETSKNGFYEFKEITSWSKSYSTAKNFARCIQEGTGIDKEVRKNHIRKMIEEKSTITGYKGVILALDLNKKNVLCDLSGSKFGCFNEDEVILLPGKYKITVLQELEKSYGKVLGFKEDISGTEMEKILNKQLMD